MIGTGRRLVQKPSSSDGTKPVVCWGRERWNVGVCSRSVSQYRNANKKKGSSGWNIGSKKGRSPTRGLSEIETGESSRLPENDPPTRTLEHRTSHRTDHLVLSGRNTREEGTGRGAPRRRRPSKGARNEKTMRGPGLAVKLHGTLERWWRKIETCERSDLWAVHHRQGRDGWEVTKVERGHTPKRWEWLKRSETQWWKWSANGRPYSRTAAARREREKGQVLGTPIQSCARPRCKASWSTSVRLCPCPAAARPGPEESQGWEAKVMPWRRSLWIWSAAGQTTKKGQRKVEDDKRGETKVRGELGVEGIVW